MSAQRFVSCFGLLFLGVMPSMLLLEGDACAQPPIATTIQDVNDDVAYWVGQDVEVEGVWIADGDRIELWVSALDAEVRGPLTWIMRLRLTDGGALPPDPTELLGDTVRVQGVVSSVPDTVLLLRVQQVGSIAVRGITIVGVGPFPPPPPPPAPEPESPPAEGPCDPCHFVLILAGFNTPDFWNDVVQTYKHKRSTALVCPDNIVVLYGQEGSRDPAVIPNGRTSGSDVASGGVFPSTAANFYSARTYFESRSKANPCPHPKLQIHSATHGLGYHTSDPQGDGEFHGYAGGMLDTDADEAHRISEQDLRFSCQMPGMFDLNGDHKPDIWVGVLVNHGPPEVKTRFVRQDKDGDGQFETLIGTDTNGDWRIDENDADWKAPDLDKSNGVSPVGFDDLLLLGWNTAISDDELKSYIHTFQLETGLTKENTKVVLDQCFGGSFTDDLADVSGQTATASEAGEFAYGLTGVGGHGYFTRPFIAALDQKKTFAQAVDEAKRSIEQDHAGVQHSQFRRSVLQSLTTFPWLLLGDTFPFSETVPPGSVGFDTTTALVKDTANNARAGGGEGVAPGDTMVYDSPFGGDDTRLDLLFRVWPGPGNYAGRNAGGQDPWVLRHHRILKVPAAGDVPGNYAAAGDGSFWGQYMANHGQVGSSPSGHTAIYWDPQTWNSARMDTAQFNYFPQESRGIGVPIIDTWMSTYHEDDPKYATLGILRDLCFLVDPAGPNDNTNTCCSAVQCAGSPFSTTWPPAAYDPLAQTATVEGTKILPDGIFTPGTLIQYFVRRSRQSNPLVVENMSPDTTVVSLQAGMGGSMDLLRYDHMGVLPDMWKDERFGGSGLACLLYVDGADRRGFEPSVCGVLDSLGYGFDNGAERGWKQTIGNWGNVDDPSGFVPKNLGQMGLAYDKFDVRAAERLEGNRLGCRIAGGGVPPELQGVQCRQGPTPAMLDHYYSTILWESGDLDHSCGALHDGSGLMGEQSDDAALLNMWIAAATSSNQKALFLSGDGVAQDLANSSTSSMNTLAYTMGLAFVDDSYFNVSGNLSAGAVFQPLATTGDRFHSARRYGFFNSSLSRLDVVDAYGGAMGAALVGRYEQFSDRHQAGVGAGPFGAAVYRGMDPGAGRYFSTLIDGFSLSRLRSWNGPGDPTTQNYSLTFNNHAQQAWLDDALIAFNLCARRAPAIAVGELPGMSALNFVRGAFPNPSIAGAATVQFTLAQPAKVTIRFYNVAGRQLHEVTVDGVDGLNSYRWEGVTSTGMKAASGVYFYRLSAPGIDFQNNSQRMVLMGGAGP